MMNEELNVLVSAGSKHGATAEIGERIGEILRKRGLTVDVRDPKHVLDVSDFDAVVLGSAVYAGHWLPEAKAIAHLVESEDPPPLTWIFSSGPMGEPPQPEEDPVDVAKIMKITSARDHRIFSGKIDKSKLSFPEKAIVVAVRAPEGDYRDWTRSESGPTTSPMSW